MMTRGKHGQAANSRRAMQDAQREAEHASAQLAKAKAQIETLIDEDRRRQDLAARTIQDLRQQVKSGSSAELAAAQERIAELEDALVDLPRQMVTHMRPIWGLVRAPNEVWPKIAEGFGLQYGEFNSLAGFGSLGRSGRRLTNRRANLNLSIKADKSFIGEA